MIEVPVVLIVSSHFRVAQVYYGLPGGSVVRNPPAKAGDSSLTAGSGRSPGGENGKPLQFLAWKIPWTEELGGLQSVGSQKDRHDLATKHQ